MIDQLGLIKRNVAEIIREDELKKKLVLYWGTMPTGSVSFAYFFPLLKIADFLKAGLKVKILFADLHAALDGVSWSLLEKRCRYYEKAVFLMLETIGVDLDGLKFVKGSEFQLNQRYVQDLLKLSSITTLNKAKHSASESVKTAKSNPKLAGLIYPLMQALDEEYLQADIQFAGLDQRKILVYAREYLPKIGYKPRIELMIPMIRGLSGEKMSSSIEDSKIDLLDDEKKIRHKINKADCVAGNVDNAIMDILKYILFSLKENKKEKLIIKRPKKYGGDLAYSSYAELEKDFISKKIHPLDLKNSVAKEINFLLKPFRENKKFIEAYKEAYFNQL